ncbi:MAG TPA: alpha/beta hydrolase [Acidimicrobiales bacterium]|nr:alpha/beta hydrolase [Acidimicrobiales bacterium]
MPLDPVLQAIANANRQSGEGRDVSQLSVEEARQGYDAIAAFGGTAPELASVVDRSIPGPAGEIPIRVYRPQGDGPFPTVVFFHGGGWVIGSLDSHDPLARHLAALTPAVTVAVDYRLAPENPFPSAADDAWAATSWVAANGEELGSDTSRLALAGDSAGGNLVAVTSQRARLEGGPDIAFQLLIYPTLDASLEHPSITENAEGPFLTRRTMEWFFQHYTGGQADASDPRLSPLSAPDLSGLPPALILTAECDPLRDEGEAYGRRLEEAGVTAKVHRYDGMAHVFLQLAGVVPQGAEAIQECAVALRSALGG